MASRRASPLMARMRSPAQTPAAAAAVRGRTAATTTPSSEERGLMRVFTLGGGGVQETEALRDVLEAGDDRESRRHPQERREPQADLEGPRQEAGQHGDDLQERRHL